MLKSIMLFILFCSALFVGCKKNDSSITKETTTQIGNVTVRTVNREVTYAIIEWAKPTGAGSNTVTYSISLNGVVLTIALTDTTYKVTDLTINGSYNGIVQAKSADGSTSTSNFTIVPYNNFLFESYYYSFSTNQGSFGCFTLTGSPVWDTGTSLFTSYPAISHDTIFLQGNTIAAYNIKTGANYWSTPKTSEQGTGLIYYKGILYTTYKQANTIVAYNASNGNQIWQNKGAAQELPAISNDMVYCENAAGLGGTYFALDYKTGAQKWTYNIPTFGAPPTTANGITFIESGTTDQSSYAASDFRALDANTGQLKWTFSFTGQLGVNYHTHPIVVNGIVYFTGYVNGFGAPNTIYALDINTGYKLWSTNTFPGATILTLGGDRNGIYVGSQQGLSKYDPLNGKLLTTYPSGDNIFTVTPGVVYAYFSNSIANAATSARISPYLGNGYNIGGHVIMINGIVYYSNGSGMSYVY